MDATGSPKKLAGRYEVRQILGQGGMGLVYRAYDTVVRREVAVKTILDIPDPASLQLFYKECDVLASMSHPNIVEIFDIGEFEEEGKKKPYFVMPLLPGTTLDHFVRKSSHHLTVERTVEIISQTCRGLQAAHERGLVHRDLKPSNIFVMEDDSVKIIDFGVAHMAKWVVNYTDPNNYDLFQIDENNFYRTDIRNGQKTNDAKIPHKGEKKSFRTLQIHVSPTEIVHQIKQGNAWFVLDRWTLPGTNLSSGRFGFYLPGGDQMSLASFSHYLDLNVH